MPYPTLPDRRMPYDADGSVVAFWHTANGIWHPADADAYLTTGEKQEIQDEDYAMIGNDSEQGNVGLIMFFPEQRVVTASFVIVGRAGDSGHYPTSYFQGSANSTNGTDGTWETATVGHHASNGDSATLYPDLWRYALATISFTGAKKVIRFGRIQNYMRSWVIIAHIYGKKASGETPDDIIFIDHDTTPGVEYATPEDFGDRALGSTLVRQFRIKNTSATLTANTIALTCSDADFSISSDGTTYGTTINVTSLAAATESATFYIKSIVPGMTLGPRFTRILATVGSWT